MGGGDGAGTGRAGGADGADGSDGLDGASSTGSTGKPDSADGGAAMTASGPADQAGPTASQRSTTRTFRPGPGFAVAVAITALVIVLMLAAAVAAALGARGASGVLGGIALVAVGAGLLALLRLPARSLVVNAPRLRLERNRARFARRRTRDAHDARDTRDPSGTGRRAGHDSSGTGGAAMPGGDLAVPLTVPGTDIAIPESTGRRELTTLDVVSGPFSTALAASTIGRVADERLAGTTAGEGLARVTQLLAGSLGFLLMALGLASILRQVLS